MQLDTPALVFLATALAIGGVCLSYLKARFHTKDHHLMILVLVAAVGYLAPMHIKRASQLERERMKQTWAGTARTFAHELERARQPLRDFDTNVLNRTLSRLTNRLAIPSGDLSLATLVTQNQDKSFKRVVVSIGIGVPDLTPSDECATEIAQAFQDQEVWCEELTPAGKTHSIQFLVPLRDQANQIEGVLMVQFSSHEWRSRQSIAEWRVVGEFLGLLSICLLMAGFLINAVETRRQKEMDQAVSELKAEVENLGGMVNSVHGVVWQRPANGRRFSFVSQQAEGAFGYSLAQWMSDRGFLVDVILEEDLPRVQAAWEDAIDNCGVYHIEYRLRRADGKLAHVVEHGQAARIPLHGIMLRGILVDVTAQREADASLKDMNRMMIDASRQAGMAEVATGVLHNVGNVLNSLNVGSKLLLERLQRSRLDRLCQAASLLKENLPHNPAFFTEDKRGQALPGYLQDLSIYLRDEQNRLAASVSDMIDRIEHIRDVIMLQQSHSKLHTLWEPLDLATVLEEALRLEASTHGGQSHFQVERQYADLPPVYMARGLLLQILVNLLSNASHAMETMPADERRLILRIGPTGGDGARIVVEDKGIGIQPHDLTNIFKQGFTTKRDGHGFGLHHASLLVEDLGGTLRAESDGLGLGARFILDLPSRTENATPPSQPSPTSLNRPVIIAGDASGEAASPS